MRCLIATEPDDHHAVLVKLALEHAGHLVQLLFTADHPIKQRNAIFMDNHRQEWISMDDSGLLSDEACDVVWWRRARKPFIARDGIHPEDYPIVVRENTAFHEGLSHAIATDAWWVNPRIAAYRSRSKLLQLRTAACCGLLIPKTVCTNDPNTIREFIVKNQPEKIIYKPLTTHVWYENKQLKVAYTSTLDPSDLTEDDLLQRLPGIYQHEIKKSYELRITCFGDYLVAAKLDSQSHEDGKVDWRKIPEGALGVVPYELPVPIREKIRLFMRRMGLVFGAIDVIVTPQGEYIFLEVNEQGQFLWIEDSNPHFNMLDIFVQFLLTHRRRFTWDERKLQHRLLDYSTDVERIVALQKQQHIHVNQADTFFYNECTHHVS